MANLESVAQATRKIVEIVVVGVIALVLLFVLFQVGVLVKNLVAPSPEAAPTVSFGKLNNLELPQTIDDKTYSYTINTLSGSLPTLPDRMTVYKFEQPAPNLLGLDKAKSIVVNAGFLDAPTALSDTSYQWSKADPLPTTITMNVQSLDFNLTSQYKTDPTVTGAAHIPDEGLAESVSKEFFDKLMPLPSSIDDSKTKTTLLAINLKGLTPATSLSNAQIIRVDYFPKALETLPIYTSNPAQSLIYTLVASGATDFPQVVEAQYFHKNISKEKATYPIKTAAQAYDDLKQGKGYIAANPTGDTNVTITDVTLGYYEDVTPQQYIWPIIVFQGDKGFYAYVSAVKDEWVQK